MLSREIYTTKYIVAMLTFGALFGLALVGVASPYEYNRLNVNIILEILLFVSLAFVFTKFKVIASVFSCVATFYVTFSFLFSYYFGVHILDFLQAYKAFFYVIILSFFIGKKLFSVALTQRLFWCLLTFFLIKYTYSSVLELTPRMGERPGLFVENNFELVFLILLLYILKSSFSYWQYAIGFLLTFLVVYLSGSRSVLACLVVVFIFSYMLSFGLLSVIYGLLGTLILFSTIYIFVDRLEGRSIESIDRVQFLFVFLQEVADWNVLKYLYGNLVLTPLSQAGCDALSYYRLLFSYSGSGECYSVILHSYILRVVFDHGVLGLIFLISFYMYGLRKNGYSHTQVLCFISVIILSSLSVSAFNSVFVAFICIIAFSIYRENQVESDSRSGIPA